MPWLELYKAPPIKKSTTYGTYLDLYHTHYLPCLGEMKLCEITQDTIQTYYQKLLRHHRTENCVQKMSLRGKIKT